MTRQYEQVGEKARMIEIALKYTGGDMEKAKLMASGKLHDVVVIKGKFVDPQQTLSGVFLAYINIVNEYISAIKTVVTSGTGVFTATRIFDDWKSQYKNVIAYESGPDAVDSVKLNSDLLESFIKKDIFPDVQSMNLDFLSVAVEEMIKESFGSEKVKCQIDLEKTSSMDVTLAGIDIMLPGLPEEEAVKHEEKVPEKKAPLGPFEKKIDEIESKASFIVEGKIVLSPVRGKYISDVISGEKIYVLLPGKDELSEKIVDAYKARDHEGKPLPVSGRIIEKVYMEGGGSIIYVLVAKGIYAKIVEEENVKIQTEITRASKKIKGQETEDEGAEPGKFMNIIIYVIFALMIVGLIVLITLM